VLRFAFACSLVLLCPQTTAAQGRWAFKVAGGYNVPTGDYSTFLEGSFQGQVGVTIFPAAGKFGVSAEFNNSWNNVEDSFLVPLGIPDAKGYLYSFTLNGVFAPGRGSGKRVGVYLVGGGGLYNRTVDFYGYQTVVPIDPWWESVAVPAGTVLTSFTDTAFGVNGGAGVAFLLKGGGSIFLEGRYHYAWNEQVDSQTLPIVLGFTYGF
jgi:Outer membrane protein beta-barrel domain